MINFLIGLCASGLCNAGIKFDTDGQTIWVDCFERDDPKKKTTYAISCIECEPDESEKG